MKRCWVSGVMMGVWRKICEYEVLREGNAD
jgi:hypothetical protein